MKIPDHVGAGFALAGFLILAIALIDSLTGCAAAPQPRPSNDYGWSAPHIQYEGDPPLDAPRPV